MSVLGAMQQKKTGAKTVRCSFKRKRGGDVSRGGRRMWICRSIDIYRHWQTVVICQAKSLGWQIDCIFYSNFYFQLFFIFSFDCLNFVWTEILFLDNWIVSKVEMKFVFNLFFCFLIWLFKFCLSWN